MHDHDRTNEDATEEGGNGGEDKESLPPNSPWSLPFPPAAPRNPPSPTPNKGETIRDDTGNGDYDGEPQARQNDGDESGDEDGQESVNAPADSTSPQDAARPVDDEDDAREAVKAMTTTPRPEAPEEAAAAKEENSQNGGQLLGGKSAFVEVPSSVNVRSHPALTGDVTEAGERSAFEAPVILGDERSEASGKDSPSQISDTIQPTVRDRTVVHDRPPSLVERQGITEGGQQTPKRRPGQGGASLRAKTASARWLQNWWRRMRSMQSAVGREDGRVRPQRTHEGGAGDTRWRTAWRHCNWDWSNGSEETPW